MVKHRLFIVPLSLALCLAALCFLDMLLGGGLGPGESLRILLATGETDYTIGRDILLRIRLPRVLTAIVAGGSLSLAGAQMQAIFRNPLSDPHIMGVSGGASLGAAISTLLLGGGHAALLSTFGGGVAVIGASLLGAVLSSFLIIMASRRFRGATTLLLFGVMLGFILSAITSILEYGASEESLKMYYSWGAGSFSGTGTGSLIVLCITLAIGSAISLLNIKGLDAILFGEEFASLSGSNTQRTRFLALLCCCILTGVVTAWCGPIGFVGIVAPHISRWLLGSSIHRRVLPCSILTGSVVTLCADIFSQCWRVPLPVGSTTALIGIPFILAILLKPGFTGK